MKKNIPLLGLLTLLLANTSGYAQTIVKQDRLAKKDSVLMDLPHNTRLILVLDKIENLRLLEKTSLDSLVSDLNRQLQTDRNLAAGTAAEPTQVKLDKKDASSGSLVISPAGEKKLDQLVLNVGVGAGLIRHTLAPSLTPGVAIRFQEKHEVSLSYNMNYFFRQNEDGRYNMAINSFLTAGLGIRFTPKGKEPRWQKLEVGYLVRSRGGYFDKDTFKVSYTYPLVSQKIHLIPELYLSNSFRTIFPGISIRFY